VAHMFGVQPRADGCTVNVEPQIPLDWGEAVLFNVCIGNARFEFRWDGTTMHVQCDDDLWSITSSTVPLRVESSRAAAIPHVQGAST
jgi:hypothetical protein